MTDSKLDSGTAPVGGGEGQQPTFGIQRIYVKDVSFEAPHVPAIFLEEWKPDMHMDLNVTVNNLPEAASYEVIIRVTITVKMKEKIAFLVEVNQAGIFSMAGFPEAQLHAMLHALCPGILFPYARAEVSDLVMKAGFPQLYLAPINFDAVYKEEMQKSQASAETAQQE